MTDPQYYPAITDLISVPALPGPLQSLGQGANNFLSVIRYRDLMIENTLNGDSRFVSLSLIIYKDEFAELVNIPFDSVPIDVTVFSEESNSVTDFHSLDMNLEWHWPIRRYFPDFQAETFGGDMRAFFDILWELSYIDDLRDFIVGLLTIFAPDVEALLNDLNARIQTRIIDLQSQSGTQTEVTVWQDLSKSLDVLSTIINTLKTDPNFNVLDFVRNPEDYTAPLSFPDPENPGQQLLISPFSHMQAYLMPVMRLASALKGSNIENDSLADQGFEGMAMTVARDIFEIIAVDISLEDMLDRAFRLFQRWMGDLTRADVERMLIPRFQAQIKNMGVRVAFPRNWLLPLHPNGEIIEEGETDSVTGQPIDKSTAEATFGTVHYSTERGFRFTEQLGGSITKSQIGNTGLIIEFG